MQVAHNSQLSAFSVFELGLGYSVREAQSRSRGMGERWRKMRACFERECWENEGWIGSDPQVGRIIKEIKFKDRFAN